METNKKCDTYTVRCFYNEKENLSYIAINFDDSTSATLAHSLGRAKYIERKGNDLPVSVGQINHGFNYMLLNTNFDDWKEEVVGSGFSKTEANKYKKMTMETLREKNVKIGNIKEASAASHQKGEGIPTYVNHLVIDPAKTDLKKFKNFCEKCSLGLDLVESVYNKIVKENYNRLIYTNNPVTRYDVWKAFKEASVTGE